MTCYRQRRDRARPAAPGSDCLLISVIWCDKHVLCYQVRISSRYVHSATYLVCATDGYGDRADLTFGLFIKAICGFYHPRKHSKIDVTAVIS